MGKIVSLMFFHKDSFGFKVEGWYAIKEARTRNYL